MSSGPERPVSSPYSIAVDQDSVNGSLQNMTASTLRARKNEIFRAVFQTDVSLPTPLLSSAEEGEAFGVLLRGSPTDALTRAGPLRLDAADDSNSTDQVKWDRAWHVVTSRIQLPTSVAVEDSFGKLIPESQDGDALFQRALSLVLYPANTIPKASHTEDILAWHSRQTRQHFIHHVLPLLTACAGQQDAVQAVSSTIQTLEAAHRQYSYGLLLVVRGMREESIAGKAVDDFQRDLHAIIGNSWTQALVDALHLVLGDMLQRVLCPGVRYLGRLQDQSRQQTSDRARQQVLSWVESLKKVGLANDKFQLLFAELMDGCMRDYIATSYTGVWDLAAGTNELPDSVPQGCMEDLGDWIENQYSRLAVEVFSILGGLITWSDVERWRETAVGRLAALRISELFDIVLQWPNSKQGLSDLRYSITTPQRRLQLTDTFSAAMQRRLLHPGRSTLEILQTYISMIRTFHVLDHSKVLLDRVVHALQLYLCQRDDAIRIVVTGLLSNPSKTGTQEKKSKLVELAVILNESSQQLRRHGDDEELDWNDMAWVPDPVDAGVNYKRPKNEDVIGTLISALGSQEIFIKEFQLIIAERLLSEQPGFQQEVKVLSLLKKRFGEHALQNCDVMVKDIQDSRRVDAHLRRTIRETRGGVQGLSYHSKILSRLFWPSLANETFTLPPPVLQVQKVYEAGFEQLKSSRKLNWLDHLGSAHVQLDLEDRSIEVECKTYEAAIIYEFQGESTTEAQPTRKAFNDLWQKLMIDEDLLELGLRYWVSKGVLRDVGDQIYEVRERLDKEENSVDGANETTTDRDKVDSGFNSPKKTKNVDAKEKERLAVLWQYIVGMLTNSAPTMPLGHMAMMLKMLIPDGFTASNEELQEFLGEKVAEGELEFSSGKYRLPKK